MYKKISFLNILPVVLGLMLSAGTATLFHACGLKDDGTWMKCHTAQEAVIAAGLIAALWFLTAALIRSYVIRVLLYILGAVGCIAIFLLPGIILPMCMLRTMRCYTVMQPSVRIMAAATAIVSAVNVLREGKTPGPLSLSVIPFRNVRTHAVRTLILLLLVMAQAACSFGGLMLMRELRQELSMADARLGADILIYPSAAMSRISAKTLIMQGTPVEVWKSRSMLERMRDCDGIEAVSYQVYVKDDSGETAVWIIGFDPETDFAIKPWISGGHENTLPNGTVLIGCHVRTNADGSVTVFGKTWPVAQRLDETGSGMDDSIFVNLSTLSGMIEEGGVETYKGIHPETDYSAALVRINKDADIDSVTHWLNTYIHKATAVRSEAVLTDTAERIRSQIRMTAVITVCAWCVLLLALAIAQSVIMGERRGELYVWHVVGASRGTILRVMLGETMVIYVPGSLLGILLASIRFGMFGLPAICIVCLSVLIGCISTIRAVKKAFRSMNGQMLLTV